MTGWVARQRTALVQLAGFAAIDTGVFLWSVIVGCIAAGVSLLIVSWLMEGDDVA